MFDRRNFVKSLGIGVGSAVAGGTAVALSNSSASAGEMSTAEAASLYDEIRNFPVDDAHCHPLTDRDAITTSGEFLSRLSLAAFPTPKYFPDGVFERWESGDAGVRAKLDRQHNIEATLAEIRYHFGESVFVKYMLREMAGFLGCATDIDSVVEARNARGANYWQYVNELFRDAGIANVMIDTGYSEGMTATGIETFEAAIAPTESRRILRVETITSRLFEEDIGFEDLEERFIEGVRAGLDGNGNFGKPSYGMKSYLMPEIGVVKPLYDPEPARSSWEELKVTRDAPSGDRWIDARRGKDLRRYLLTIALEECLARDIPMQFHAGDGEAPGIILRNQNPYFLEEVVRFDRDGVMRMPKIVPIHAGYPLVGQAAWLSHLYTNCYFELSIMTPFAHHGLLQRYLEVMEAVPVSKILFGSDAYHVPELYWLAARWGKRYLSEALAVYVRSNVLSVDEAIAAARKILYENARRLYKLRTE